MSKKGRFPNPGSSGLKGLLLMLGLVVLAVGYFVWVVYNQSEAVVFNYSEVLAASDAGAIDKVEVGSDRVYGELKSGQHFLANVLLSEGLLEKLRVGGAQVNFVPASNMSWPLYMCLILLSIVLGVGIFYLVSFFLKGGLGGGGNGKIFSMNKSTARFHPTDTIKVKFSDVAGYGEVKAELIDVVEFLKHPDKFKRIGARIPRGVLLSGAPGNGKTLLAKAVAGEAGCPFLSISGSDFVEVFVGVGASRVRDLFYQARANTPCIIFIDEIDTIGRQRGGSFGGGNEEREQTLNQLLSEMDGFSTQPGEVIVLAATNRIDVLDKALLRPGRFDRTVNIPFPDLATRRSILEIHTRKIKMDPSVNLDSLARGTTGFSGADLANLINEAALFAAKRGSLVVELSDLDTARDKELLGLKNSSLIITKEELRETAYHEAGHTAMNVLLPNTDPFFKVTIVSRGHALGVTMSMPEKDILNRNKDYYLAEIRVLMGGLAAEKMFLNTHSTGISSDLNAATTFAKAMVRSLGMSDLGPVVFDLNRGAWGRPDYSEATSEKIDQEIAKILQDALQDTTQILEQHKDKVQILAERLLEKETLHAEEVYEIFGLPVRKTYNLESNKVVGVEPAADISGDKDTQE